MAASLIFLTACGKPDAQEMAEQDAQLVQSAQKWTAEAFAVLSGRLLDAIETDGHASAIDVCGMEAKDLLDGVAEVHGASIRRVTDRPRNPANQADARDLEVMEMIHAMLADGGEVEASIEKGVVRMPIRISMPLCLTCHGDPESDIPAETLVAIRGRYPTDMAIRYKMGDLRGLWRVEISHKNPQ
jgi:hypothetical protein